MKRAASQAERELTRGRARAEKELDAQIKYLSTGSTLLNLACAGRWSGGFRNGTYNFLVGDSASGKTFLSLTCMAEAAINSAYDDFQLIYDPAENGAMMDFSKFFGRKMAERVTAPSDEGFSSTTEEFYYNLDRRLKDGPCVYVLDSMDALSTEDDDAKFESRKSGKSENGSYGTSKAKMNSAYMRTVIPKLEKSGSILIVIAQTRDNIGFGAQFNPKTRSGGHALRFYAHLELWSSRKETIKKELAGGKGLAKKDRQLGIKSLVKVKKNRHTGREREVVIPIYHSTGIDDIGSCVSYLIDEGHWKKSGGRVTAPEFDFTGTEEQLCRHIDTQPIKMGKVKLRKLAGAVWKSIENACRIERRNPYLEE